MKFLGLDFFRNSFAIDSPTGEVTVFLPFPSVRRYEKLVVTSTKKEDGSVEHDLDIKYAMRFHKDPTSLFLSRFTTSKRLCKGNEENLQDKDMGGKVTSREYLFSRY